jgi:hypothetical protein
MRILILAASVCFLAACSSDNGIPGAGVPETTIGNASNSGGSWWWPFGGEDVEDTTTIDAPALGVNAYLWRATLDTLNFMPLASSDPIGGVVITDWYSAPETPSERVKVTTYILDRRLRADALRVSVFRQTLDDGMWVDAQTNPDTAVRLENAILTRAREIHISLIQ